uniref:UDP-glycosyltransferase n=1 Tax=Polyphagotarsonemus latus TaxID=1204166 RepID=A0AAN0N7Z6_9ACAR
MEQVKKDVLLIIPLLTQGHTNVCAAIGKKFLEKYGSTIDVYFMVDEEYKTKLSKIDQNFKFSLLSDFFDKAMDTFLEKKEEKNTHYILDSFREFGKLWHLDTKEYIQKSTYLFTLDFEAMNNNYDQMTEMIKKLKPKFIILDNLFSYPLGVDQGIPYANLLSSAITYFGHDQLPPPQSSLPSEYTPENLKLWKEFIDATYKVGNFKELKDKINEKLKLHNCPNLDDKYFLYKESKYLNIYNYPKFLDYENENIKYPGPWFRIQSSIIKPIPDPYPVILKDLPGKLIYFSLGSMASVYKPLMEKILSILSQIPHRFIVSTGMVGEQYELSKNMHGEKFVNQLAALQTVDIVISHGGNNTLTEAFYFGKPLVVMPLFGDQKDNAFRVDEIGLGKKINTFNFTKEEMENAIEYCLKDEVIEKMKLCSQLIQNDNSLDLLCEEVKKYF